MKKWVNKEEMNFFMAIPNPSQLTPPQGTTCLSINFAVSSILKNYIFFISIKRGNLYLNINKKFISFNMQIIMYCFALVE